MKQKHRNWLTRAWYTLTDAADESIVNPEHLDRDAATQVCGQCHGQRLPKSVEIMREFIDEGPIYRPGEDLFESVDLVWPDSELPVVGHGIDFAERFWPDGTPRLPKVPLTDDWLVYKNYADHRLEPSKNTFRNCL